MVSGGIEATVQDVPGRRIGLGIPQSGPMDAQAFEAGNLLAGNNTETEGLEIVTLPGAGCKFIFHVPCVVAVTGKSVTVKVNREPVPMWARLVVPAKGTLEIGGEPSDGFRVYLAVRGGFPEIPQYLGSKSTSMGLGGYQVSLGHIQSKPGTHSCNRGERSNPVTRSPSAIVCQTLLGYRNPFRSRSKRYSFLYTTKTGSSMSSLVRMTTKNF